MLGLASRRSASPAHLDEATVARSLWSQDSLDLVDRALDARRLRDASPGSGKLDARHS